MTSPVCQAATYLAALRGEVQLKDGIAFRVTDVWMAYFGYDTGVPQPHLAFTWSANAPTTCPSKYTDFS